jgi:hypothetical protein
MIGAGKYLYCFVKTIQRGSKIFQYGFRFIKQNIKADGTYFFDVIREEFSYCLSQSSKEKGKN